MFGHSEDSPNHHHHHNHHINPSRHEHHFNKSLSKILNLKRDILLTSQSSIFTDYYQTPPPFDQSSSQNPRHDLLPDNVALESNPFKTVYSSQIAKTLLVDQYASVIANLSSQAFVSSSVHSTNSASYSSVSSISPTISALSTDFVTQVSNKTYEEHELLSANWQVMLVILYSLTAALALIGNVISIWVLMSGKRSSKELRLFLVNLSLSDILMALFSIPFTYTDFMLDRWIFMPAFCPVVQLMQMTSTFVSIYTLTVIGIDRYIAIIYPLLSGRFNRSSLGTTTLVFIWICGFTLGLVQWANTHAEPFYISGELNYKCKETWSSEQKRSLTISLFLITFALPMSMLSFTYGSVGMKMFHHSTPGNADVARDRAQHSSKIKIIKMLATIVILFAICWLPWHILNLFIYFARDFMIKMSDYHLGLYVTITFTAHWFSMANSFVNPIIYCFMSENFRTDLRLLLRKCLRRNPFYICGASQRHRASTYQSSNIYRTSVYEMSIKSNHTTHNNNNNNHHCNYNNIVNQESKINVHRLSNQGLLPHYQPATTAYSSSDHNLLHHHHHHNRKLSKRLRLDKCESRSNSSLPSLLNGKSTPNGNGDDEEQHNTSSSASSLILLNSHHQPAQLVASGNSLDNSKSSPQFSTTIQSKPFVNETNSVKCFSSLFAAETVTLVGLNAASKASIQKASITTNESADAGTPPPVAQPETAPNAFESATTTSMTATSVGTGGSTSAQYLPTTTAANNNSK